MHIRDRLAPRPFKDLLAERIQNRADTGLTVRNEGSKAVIRIYDVIGWPFIEAQDVAAALDELDAEEVEVQINSPGGDAFEGVAIYNALRSHPAKVTTRVDGLAASAASIIAQAGDHRQILSGAQMMIHDAWALAIGDSKVMYETGDVLDKLSENLAEIYEDRSGKSGFRDLMKAESWFTHDEAVDAGLADESVKPSKGARAQAHESFNDRLDAAVAGVEQVVEELETVSESRSSQGKPPLSDSAKERVDRMLSVLSAFADVSGEPENTETTSDVVSELAARLPESEPEWMSNLRKELNYGADASAAPREP